MHLGLGSGGVGMSQMVLLLDLHLATVLVTAVVVLQCLLCKRAV
jgi:hypothetical protein